MNTDIDTTTKETYFQCKVTDVENKDVIFVCRLNVTTFEEAEQFILSSVNNGFLRIMDSNYYVLYPLRRVSIIITPGSVIDYSNKVKQNICRSFALTSNV